MDMPRPTAAHHRLDRLAGVWRGKETMHPSPWDPQGGVADGESRVRMGLGGFAAIVDYRQTRNGELTFEGHGVYTVDPKTEDVVLHWFDSMGQGAELFRGVWEGERLSLTSQGAMGGARLCYDYSVAGRLQSRMEMCMDGEEWRVLFDCEYERVTET
ncbi:MAG: DUF1579 family protein [Planctomycetes bacterium]|nr:DUF1579 family protein [Planctomycetota bacterium]MCB9885503.1 DUF1579 family protein [Planctomycetota bacterium]